MLYIESHFVRFRDAAESVHQVQDGDREGGRHAYFLHTSIGRNGRLHHTCREKWYFIRGVCVWVTVGIPQLWEDKDAKGKLSKLNSKVSVVLPS